ncbi:NAD(P)-dependent oxidoreductase [Rhodobacteraceae bacterium B1Z28]|uniref:NAD(P)-dependent oxidoreductase n=1 Tax=Ruegeria haliotis TaxID=2747601 RepID=A0ABX2PQF9_9RHOB|nr:NAD(P)-dependent oxidoreductase [Ruegeria haliotis]NVO56385.1 NAD(P)-dependent oxidoreductase [Ruegeria haliotis]
MMRVLITGSNGFIGSHLVQACLARGDQVTAVVRSGSSADRLISVGPGVELCRVDLMCEAEIQNVFAEFRPDQVYHAAAKTRIPPAANLSDSVDSLEENVQSFLSVLRAAASSKAPPGAFVRLGTIAEYGDIPVPYVETQCERPRDSYGASMLTGTKYLEMLQSRLPFPAVTARLSLTYGPGQTGHQLVPYLIECLLSHRAAHIGRPDDARDLIHVDDVVRGLLLLGSDPSTAGPVVNISTGVPTKVRDVAMLLRDMIMAPEDLLQFGCPETPPMDLVNDPTLMKSSHNWKSQLPLIEGLRNTVEWAKHNHHGAKVTGQAS